MKQVRQRKTNTVYSHFYMETKKAGLTETESRMMVSRGWKGGGCGEMLVKVYKLPTVR